MKSRELIRTRNDLVAFESEWLNVVRARNGHPPPSTSGTTVIEPKADPGVLASLSRVNRGLMGYASKQWYLYHQLKARADVALKVLPEEALVDLM